MRRLKRESRKSSSDAVSGNSEAPSKMKYVWIYLAVACFLGTGACAVFITLPEYRPLLVQEDSLVEDLSAMFFALAALYSFRLLLQSKADRRLVMLLASISTVGFLDEVSFGQRILGLSMPVIGGIRLDAVHDLAEIALHYGVLSIPLLLVFAIGLGAAVWWRLASRGWSVRHLVRPEYLLLLLCFLSIGVAMVLDLDLIRHHLSDVAEETLEMNAALALLFCAQCVRDGRSARASVPTLTRDAVRL